MESVTLKRRTSTGKIQLWKIWVKDDTVYNEWGQQDGVLQKTSDKKTHKGKAGTKAYRDAKQVAIDTALSQIEGKKKKGYSEELLEINFEPLQYPLPRSIKFFKPVNSSSMEEQLERLKDIKNPILTIKRNGHCYILQRVGEWKFYTRTLEDRTENIRTSLGEDFKVLQTELDNLGFKDGTIIFCEALVKDLSSGKDNPQLAASWLRSEGSAAREAFRNIYVANSVPEFYLIYPITIDGNINTTSFEDTFNDLKARFKEAFGSLNKFTRCLETYPYYDIKGLLNIIESKDFVHEGFVIYDAKENPGTKLYTVTGEPKRPKSVIKFKCIPELDFLVLPSLETGTGKNQGLLKDVLVYEKNGKSIELVYKFGIFTDDQRKFYTTTKEWPRVFSLKVRERSEDGKLKFVSFVKDHTIERTKDVSELGYSKADITRLWDSRGD